MTEAEIFRAFTTHHTDKADQGYTEYYETIFNICKPSSLLEIGIRSGNCLIAFKKLFPECRVVGVDINLSQTSRHFKRYDDLGVEYYECDATLPSIFNKIGKTKFDIIIDDGSHFYKNQIDSFNLLKDSFNSFYVLEDLRWKKEEVISSITEQGFKKVIHGHSLNPPLVANKQFLDTNIGQVFCPISNRIISGLYDPSGEQVEITNDFVVFARG